MDSLHYGLRKRSEIPPLDDYSRLDPSDSELLMFGAPIDDGGYFIANMTLRAPPLTRLLLMEKFEGLTTTVDCSTLGDNKLSITFASQDIFNYVQKWSWINEHAENAFLMITNHDGCGPEAERAVFWVTKVDYVEEDLSVDFYAVETEWGKVAGTYAVDFGTLVQEEGHEQGLQRRDPVDIKRAFEDAGRKIKGAFIDVGDFAEDSAKKVEIGVKIAAKDVEKAFIDAGKWIATLPTNIKKDLEKLDKELKVKFMRSAQKLKAAGKDFVKVFNQAKAKLGNKFTDVARVLSELGDGSVGKSNISLNLAAGKPGVKKNIYTDFIRPNDPRYIIDCLDCYVTGKILFSGHLQFENFIPKSAFFETKPQDLSTMVKFRVFINASSDKNGDGKPDPLRIEKDIYSIGLPALSIPNIFLLGPKAELSFGFKSEIKSSADFTFGVKGSAPNTALFRKDLLNKKAPNTSTKWEGAKIDTLPLELLSGAIDMNFEVSVNLVLGIAIDVAGMVGYEAGFKLQIPRMAVGMQTVSNKDGWAACEGERNRSPTGVVVTSDVNLDLLAIAGQDTMVNGKYVENKLLGIKFPFPKKCYSIADKRQEQATIDGAHNDILPAYAEQGPTLEAGTVGGTAAQATGLLSPIVAGQTDELTGYQLPPPYDLTTAAPTAATEVMPPMQAAQDSQLLGYFDDAVVGATDATDVAAPVQAAQGQLTGYPDDSVAAAMVPIPPVHTIQNGQLTGYPDDSVAPDTAQLPSASATEGGQLAGYPEDTLSITTTGQVSQGIDQSYIPPPTYIEATSPPAALGAVNEVESNALYGTTQPLQQVPAAAVDGSVDKPIIPDGPAVADTVFGYIARKI